MNVGHAVRWGRRFRLPIALVGQAVSLRTGCHPVHLPKASSLLGALATLMTAACLFAQAPPGPPQPPRTAKAAAPVDFTGYWVSPVMEDWRWRMVTPLKGDFSSIPINRAAYDVGQAWNPAKDEAAGLACKSYGAPAIMRVPGRLRISWPDDNTLRIETDAGTQTRLFHFGSAQASSGQPDWQGFSVASWEGGPAGRGGRGGGGRGDGGAAAETNPAGGTAGERAPRGGTLKVVTTHMRPGYLRKNGVPYSGNATMTEYFDRAKEENGDSWLVVTTIVDDPQYLQQPFITSTHFKLESDGSKWSPSPCTAR